MKLNSKVVIASIWQGTVSFLSPVCVGLIYMDITGHSKGYSYDLGSEADISIMFGIVELLFWLLALVPVTIWLSRYYKRIQKWMVLLPWFLFFLLFLLGLSTFGFQNFLAALGIGID